MVWYHSILIGPPTEPIQFIMMRCKTQPFKLTHWPIDNIVIISDDDESKILDGKTRRQILRRWSGGCRAQSIIR